MSETNNTTGQMTLTEKGKMLLELFADVDNAITKLKAFQAPFLTKDIMTDATHETILNAIFQVENMIRKVKNDLRYDEVFKLLKERIDIENAKEKTDTVEVNPISSQNRYSLEAIVARLDAQQDSIKKINKRLDDFLYTFLGPTN